MEIAADILGILAVLMTGIPAIVVVHFALRRGLFGKGNKDIKSPVLDERLNALVNRIGAQEFRWLPWLYRCLWLGVGCGTLSYAVALLVKLSRP